MIVKMKKVTLLIAESEIDADLTLLGQLGIMHITPFKPAIDESIDRVLARIESMKKAISLLEEFEKDPLPDNEKINLTEEIHGEVTLMEQVIKADEKRKRLIEKLETLRKNKEWYDEWGKVDSPVIKELANAGVFIRIYLVNKQELKHIDNRSDVVIAGQKDDLYKVVLISDNENEKLQFEEVPVPKYKEDSIDNYILNTEEELSDNKTLLQQFHTQIDLLRDALDERYRRYGVRSVQYTGESVDEVFSYWQGYMPDSATKEFTELAEKNNWGYVIEDPSQNELEDVPTVLRSPKWVERIKPVMNFMGLVPGYNEIDVSHVFMIFFTFFSGILVGDAGYGLVFFLITLLVHYKQKFKPKIEFGLLYTLSGSIMLWGVITGTYFGVKEIAEIPILSQLVISKIASFGGDEVFLQKFMFILGAIHLTIGHLQAAWKYNNSVRAIAQFGWIAIVWGLYLFINQMVLLIPAPSYMIWLFVGGIVLVALFSQPQKNFFKGMVSSLADLPLNVISGFSDIISYIRLYAVGLATVLMAASFNEMAVGDGITTFFAGIVAVLILVLGHALNMILAAMAIIVHGVRLNMLEYAGHAGVTFSGNEYKPFKLKKEVFNN
ncbi:MAG: V-type ATP synthase subunit I [Bacillota bacterium]